MSVVTQEILIIRRNCKKNYISNVSLCRKKERVLTCSRNTYVFNAFWGTLDKETCSIVAKLPDDDTCAAKIGDKFETPQYSKLEGVLDPVRYEAVA